MRLPVLPNFLDKETDAFRDELTCSKSYHVKLVLKARQLDVKASTEFKHYLYSLRRLSYHFPKPSRAYPSQGHLTCHSPCLKLPPLRFSYKLWLKCHHFRKAFCDHSTWNGPPPSMLFGLSFFIILYPSYFHPNYNTSLFLKLYYTCIDVLAYCLSPY